MNPEPGKNLKDFVGDVIDVNIPEFPWRLRRNPQNNHSRYRKPHVRLQSSESSIHVKRTTTLKHSGSVTVLAAMDIH
jgi:hypothetical protein